jgi:hypothetical protein
MFFVTQSILQRNHQITHFNLDNYFAVLIFNVYMYKN